MPLSETEKESASKLTEYSAVDLPILTCAFKTWTVCLSHSRLLNLRKIMNIKWQEKVQETKVLVKAGLPSIYTSLM